MSSEKGNELNNFILSVPLFIQFISHSAEDTFIYVPKKYKSTLFFISYHFIPPD